MNRLILGTCLLLLVIGGWLAEAQIPIVRPIPPHTIGNPISPGNITAPATGGPYTVGQYDVNNGVDVIAHGMACDGITDDTTAANVLGTSAFNNKTLLVPQGSTCLVDHWAFTGDNITLRSEGRTNAIIEVTGTGTGACSSAQANGGITVQHADWYAQGITFAVASGATSLDCLLHINNGGTSSNVNLKDVEFETLSLPIASTNPIAIEADGAALVGLYMDKVFIRDDEFRQQMLINSTSANQVSITNSSFNRNSFSYGASPVTNNRNYEVQFKQVGGGAISATVFEYGPNQFKVVSGVRSPLEVSGNYFGDGAACLPWVDSTTYAAGACVVPATATAATTAGTTTITSLGSIAGLAVGLPVVIQGAGAAGANLFTNVTSIDSASQIHVANAATSSGATNLYSATLPFANHIYFNVNTSGTSSGAGSQPMFPTSASATVSDGANIVWMEYQTGACAYVNSPAVSFDGNLFACPYIGIALVNDANGSAYGNKVSGNALGSNGFAGFGTWCSGCRGLSFNGNHSYSQGMMLDVEDGSSGIHAQNITSGGNYNLLQAFAGILSESAATNGGFFDTGTQVLSALGEIATQTTLTPPVGWAHLNATGGGFGVNGPLYVSGTQQYPNPVVTSIAGLPSPCATPGAGTLYQGITGYWVNNSNASTWGSTPAATATVNPAIPVRCWPDGAWHISN